MLKYKTEELAIHAVEGSPRVQRERTKVDLQCLKKG